MHVSFGKTAYVAGTPASILDEIEKDLSVSMTGDGLVCVDWDEIPEEDPGEEATTVEAFLWDARQTILAELEEGTRIGDVVFVL